MIEPEDGYEAYLGDGKGKLFPDRKQREYVFARVDLAGDGCPRRYVIFCSCSYLRIYDTPVRVKLNGAGIFEVVAIDSFEVVAIDPAKPPPSLLTGREPALSSRNLR